MSASASPVLPDQNQRRDAVSRYQAEHGSEVDDILTRRRAYVESQARDFEVDPDLVRAVVKYKALSEDFRSSSVVKAPDMGEASDPMSRAIQGAAVWLGEARKQLQKNGVDAPSNEQILDQYAAQRKAEHPNGAGMLRVMYRQVARERDAAQAGGQDVLKEIARSEGKPEHIGLYVAPTAKLGETKEQREDAEIDEAIAKRFQREHPLLWRLTEIIQGAKSNIPVFDSKSDDEDKSFLQKRRDLLSLREINGSSFNPAGMFVQDNGNGQLGINYRGIGAFGGNVLVGMGTGMLGGAKLPRLNLRQRYEAVVTNATDALKKNAVDYDLQKKSVTVGGKPISGDKAAEVARQKAQQAKKENLPQSQPFSQGSTKQHEQVLLEKEEQLSDSSAGASKNKQDKPLGEDSKAGRESPAWVKLSSGGSFSAEEAADLLNASRDHPIAKAMQTWFGGSHRKIQAGELLKYEAPLRDFLLRLPPYQSKEPLYRGLSFPGEAERELFIRSLETGDLAGDRPFVAASKRFGAAKRMAIKTNFPVIVEIRKHRSGRDIEPFAKVIAPEYTRQREVLFRKASRFKIVAKRDVDLGGRKGVFIELDEIDE